MPTVNEIFKSLTFSGWKLQGRKKFQGLDISIENSKGSVRRGVDKDGHEWETKMHADYGYVRGTVGKDKDHLDCYLGPNKDSRRVFIVHQNDPSTGKYDEDKCFLGFDTPEEAKSLYMKQYNRPGFFGEMDETDIDTFKEHALAKENHGKKLVIRRTKNPELEIGIKVEMEHTDDPEEAKKIALDHIGENPKYYSKLIAAGLVDEKAALDEAKRQGLKKSFDGEVDKKFYAAFKAMFGDDEGRLYSGRNGHKLKELEGFPKKVSLENCDIIRLGKDVIYFAVGGDWQQSINVGVGMREGKLKVVSVFENVERQKVTDMKQVKVAAGMQKSREWSNHKYIKKVGNKYFYTEEEIRNFKLQKRGDGFYYMDETKITNDPEKARLFEEKVREHKSAERSVQIGEKVQIKPDHRGSVGRGIVGFVKEIGDGYARIEDAVGRMFRVPTEALVFARSQPDTEEVLIKSVIWELQKSDDGKHHLVQKRIIVSSKDGKTYSTTRMVKPDNGKYSGKPKTTRLVVSANKEKPSSSEKAELWLKLGDKDRKREYLKFSSSPKILEKAGLKAGTPIVIHTDKLSTVMKNEQDGGRGKHGLTNAQIIDVQAGIYDPVAIIKSHNEDRKERIIVLTDVLDEKGRPINVVIEPYCTKYNGEDAHMMFSIYGREKLDGFLEACRAHNSFIYRNEKRMNALTGDNKEQFQKSSPGCSSLHRDYNYFPEKINTATRYVVHILEKSRKNTKLIPQKKMVTRDGRTFQTTVWVLPGQENGPVQGGFDFDAEPETPKRNLAEDLDGRLEVAFKQAKPKTKEGFFTALGQQLGGDKELQAEFARRFNIDASLPGPERKSHILEKIDGEYKKQKDAHKDRNEAYRQSKADEKKAKTGRAMTAIEALAMESENAMQEQIKQRDESDKILPGEQMPRKDLEAFKRRMNKEAEDRAEWHRTHKDPPEVVDPEWTTLEGQDVLRIEGSKFVAAPITGKKNASRFVVFNIDERKELAQISNKEVNRWLRKRYENEIENGKTEAPVDADNETEKQYDELYEKNKSWMPARINDADYVAFKALGAVKKAELAKKAFMDGTFDEAFKRVTQVADDSLVGQYGKKEFKAGWSSIKSAVKWFVENRLDEMAKESQTGNVFQKPFAMKYGGYQAMQAARKAAAGKGKSDSSSSQLENTGIDLSGEVWSNGPSRVTWDSPIGVITLEKGQYKSDQVKIGISVSEAGNAMISHAKKQGII